MKMTNMVFSPWEAEQLINGIRLQYGLDIQGIVERRSVYGLIGKEVNWIWKPIGEVDDELRLYELASMTNHISQQGLLCGGPIPSLYGRFISVPYAGARPGFLQLWLPGRHVNAANTEERRSAIRAIGRLHGLGRTINLTAFKTLHRGGLLSKMKMKMRTMQEVWPQAKERAQILESIEPYIWHTMEQCIFEYESSVKHNFPAACFCHRDLAPHNLLWNSRESGDFAISIIDFDHSGYDDPIHDVIQFTSHCVFLSDCSASDIEQMVMDYTLEVNLPEERLQLLRHLLSWPDILIRTVVEWCRHGFEPEKKIRVIHAVRKEERRMQLLKEIDFARKV